MNITELENVKTFLEDKINRIRNFEAEVQSNDKTKESEQLNKLYDKILNPRAKLYVDVDKVIADKEIANSLQCDIVSNVFLERFDFIGIAPLDNVDYYYDVWGQKVYVKYPQVYAYLIPEYNEFSGQWNYEEKILFLKESVSYGWEVLKAFKN